MFTLDVGLSYLKPKRPSIQFYSKNMTAVPARMVRSWCFVQEAQWHGLHLSDLAKYDSLTSSTIESRTRAVAIGNAVQ